MNAEGQKLCRQEVYLYGDYYHKDTFTSAVLVESNFVVSHASTSWALCEHVTQHPQDLAFFKSISAITHVLPTRIRLIVLVLAFSAVCCGNSNCDQI